MAAMIPSGYELESENVKDQERRDMNTDNTRDGAEPSLASAGSVAIADSHTMRIGYDEWYCQWYRCPKCEEGHIARSFRYCPDCGVQLQWQKHQPPSP